MEAGSQAKVEDTIIFFFPLLQAFYKVFMGTPQDHVDEDAFAAALMAASASLVLLYVLSVGWSL